jgi:mediator of RNA polymerase II transcription subunit 13
MDFPGGAITNISVIVSATSVCYVARWVINDFCQDGFSHIYWRIYTEDSSIGTQSSDSNTQNNGYNILKHLSRLKDLELKLRNQDCLVSCYPRRLGLWIFSATPGFESLSPLVQESAGQDPNRLLIGPVSLKGNSSLSQHHIKQSY